jgi:hypothetical protein
MSIIKQIEDAVKNGKLAEPFGKKDGKYTIEASNG